MRVFLQEFADRQALRRLESDGNFPPVLKRPFRYLTERRFEPSPEEMRVFDAIEAQRARMVQESHFAVSIYYSPRPDGVINPDRPKPGDVKAFDVARIASHTSVSPYWGRFLHILARECGARTIL